MRLPRDEEHDAQMEQIPQSAKSYLHPSNWCHWLSTGGYGTSRAIHTQANLNVAIQAYGRRCGNPV